MDKNICYTKMLGQVNIPINTDKTNPCTQKYINHTKEAFKNIWSLKKYG